MSCSDDILALAEKIGKQVREDRALTKKIELLLKSY